MLYNIEYDAQTRQMTVADIVDDHEEDNTLVFRIVDTEHLLDGYEAYVVFDYGTRQLIISGSVTVPYRDCNIFYQLLFIKDDYRCYSLNMLKITRG